VPEPRWTGPRALKQILLAAHSFCNEPIEAGVRSLIEMRGADAYFLWEESRARHMHTLKILVVDPSTAHHEVGFERLRLGAQLVLPRLAAFRRRPVGIPLGLGHPLWIDAPRLDLDYHLHHERLPAGSGEEALDELLGRIASEPLDRERPLWQIFFVEGLPGGCVAYVTKLHHAVADGVASAALVLHALQEDPQPAALPTPYEGGQEPVPPAAERLLRSLGRELRRQRELPSLLARSIRDVRSGLQRRAGLPVPPRAFTSPPTRFNRPLSPSRICAHVRLPLSGLREAKSGLDCTLNDVYLAIVGGALRSYLERHGELPEEPLSAAVPVSARREGDDPLFGNATAYWFATTASHLADPLERLRAVAESTRVARVLFAERDPRLPLEWLDHWPLRRLYLDGLSWLGGALLQRPAYNVIVSNVRGPSRPLYNDGARLAGLYSIGPLTLQQGLNFTAWSYLDDFTVGLHACRDAVPDLRSLADALPVELEALLQAASRAQARAG
jgi:diacylglycerol O-acyltransferase